jgi:hypothetical protein
MKQKFIQRRLRKLKHLSSTAFNPDLMLRALAGGFDPHAIRFLMKTSANSRPMDHPKNIDKG